ncbi:MAG: glycosyltransferase family 4 protein [Methanobacterium sp.]
MKICILSDFFIPHYNGGGERRYFEIAKRLVDKGHSVHVICMKIQGVDDHEVIDGVDVYHVGPLIKNPPYRNAFNFIHFMISVFLWILKHDYDVIDAQTYVPLIPGFFGAKIKNIPVIGTIHDVGSGTDDQWLMFSNLASFFEKILVKLPYNKIITISNQTKNALIQNYNVKQKRICVVYGGVDFNFIDYINVNKKYENSIIFVGRLAPHKHVDDLIEAIDILKKSIPSVKLRIIGNGIEKDKLIKLVNDLNLNKQIDFLANLEYSEVIEEMKRSNILVLPSTREGFGLVLAEANACNIPVIAYKSGGVVEVIENNKNGFLIEPRNINELSEKIKFLLENEEIAREMGEYGRKKVQKCFNWENIIEEIIKIYKKTKK